MRAFIVVLALAATPFLAGVSQSPQGLDCDNGQGDENRSDSGQAHAHQGLCADADRDGVPDILDRCPNTPLGTPVDASGCPVDGNPPPFCQTSGMSGGTGSVMGQVFVASTFVLLGDWCVHLLDPGTGAVLATVTTSTGPIDIEGNNWVFTNVPGGTYTVCEEPPPNQTWFQFLPTSGPPCPGPLPVGLSAFLMDGGAADFLWFWNTQ
jgi:hypothetical protein